MRTVILGTGGFGAGWRDYFAGERAGEVVALVDAVAANNQAFAASIGRPNVPCFGRLDDALERVTADLVVDSAPPRFRERHARAAFAAGCHLFVTKPLAETMEVARDMVAAAAAAGRQLGVGQQQRYYPVAQTLARLVHQGAIGQPTVVYLDFYERRVWQDRMMAVPSPLFVESSVHHFDMLRYVLDRLPQRVCALGWTPTWTGATGETAGAAWLEFAGDVRALYRGSRSGRSDLDAELQTGWHGPWVIEGTDGVLRGDERAGLFLNGSCVLPAAEAAPASAHSDARKASLDRFERAIALGEPFEIGGADNLWTLAASYGAWQSARERRWVELAPLVNGTDQ